MTYVTFDWLRRDISTPMHWPTICAYKGPWLQFKISYIYVPILSLSLILILNIYNLLKCLSASANNPNVINKINAGA